MGIRRERREREGQSVGGRRQRAEGSGQRAVLLETFRDCARKRQDRLTVRSGPASIQDFATNRVRGYGSTT